MFGTILEITNQLLGYLFREKTMLELLFVIGFFVMLLVTGISLLGIIAAMVAATALMFFGGLFALMIKLLPWLLLAVVAVWVIRAIKSPTTNRYRREDRWRY
jgi:phage shock protein G